MSTVDNQEKIMLATFQEEVEWAFCFSYGKCFNRYAVYALLDKTTPK